MMNDADRGFCNRARRSLMDDGVVPNPRNAFSESDLSEGEVQIAPIPIQNISYFAK